MQTITRPGPAASPTERLATLHQTYDCLRDLLAVESSHQISAELRSHGICFEGTTLPVSLAPTLLAHHDAATVADGGAILRNILNRVLRQFVAEHQQHSLDGPMHRFFTPYYQSWDLIASERRVFDPIQLMRFDAVRTPAGRWSFLETNTACPGGVIHCARVRTAWLNSLLGQAVTADAELTESAVDDATGFVRFLAGQAETVSPSEPNIAILNHKGDYTNELESLRSCHALLRQAGDLPNGSLLLGDIRDLETVDGSTYLNGIKIALIYNKLDPLQIDPADPAVLAWVRAAQSPTVEFLNSIGSLYLTEAKRSLALLSDPEWNQHLGLTDQELMAIAEFVPYTRLLHDAVAPGLPGDSLPARARNSFVLKADCLTRGAGVYIGSNCDDAGWLAHLAAIQAQHGVAQLMCDLPTREGIHVTPSDEVIPVTEYFGVDVFYFGDSFAGVVGRSHTSQILNIGNGGRETPVLVVADLRA